MPLFNSPPPAFQRPPPLRRSKRDGGALLPTTTYPSVLFCSNARWRDSFAHHCTSTLLARTRDPQACAYLADRIRRGGMPSSSLCVVSTARTRYVLNLFPFSKSTNYLQFGYDAMRRISFLVAHVLLDTMKRDSGQCS
jgi:hypothetical protein